MKTSASTHLHALTLAVGLAVTGFSHALEITRDFSGSWYDTAQPGQGFSMDVVRTGAGKQLLVYWYTFDLEGRPLWLVGNAPIAGDKAVVPVFSAAGGRFGQAFDPSDVQLAQWGTLTVQFASCAAGQVSWQANDPAYGSGTWALDRLSTQVGSACTGTLSDDLARSEQGTEIIDRFVASSLAPAASGKARWRARNGRIDFDVEAEDLPLGIYMLQVGGTVRGQIEVVAVAGGTRGKIEFGSPPEAGEFPLEFDPRGEAIMLVRSGQIYLSTSLAEGGSSTPPPPVAGSESEYYLRLTAQSSQASGRADAELEIDAVRTEFKVELERMPVGAYELHVAGELQGVIQVIATASGTRGELEFKTPMDDGHPLLEFDPRGSSIEIVSSGQLLFAGQFPTSPTTIGGDDGDDDGDDDNGGDDGGEDDNGGDDNGGDDDDDDDDDDDNGGGGDDDNDD